jgi:hypothetical protein
MRAVSRRIALAAALVAGLYSLSAASAQSPQTPPAAPQPANPNDPGATLAPAPATPLLAVSGTPAPSGPMSLRERFVFETHAAFGPLAFIVPALGSGYTMIRPPANYPKDWTDGPAAFARNYGAEFGSNIAGGFAHFATAAIVHEDPRYYPSSNPRFGRRIVHALYFTVFDQSDRGTRMVAVSNIAAAGASGFIGNLWEPAGFNDTPHALERGSIQFATYAGHNLLLEFSPELSKGLVKLHLIHPKPSNP